MPKFKSKTTGEIYEGDEYGNPISKKAWTEPKPPEQTIRATTLDDEIFSNFGRFVPTGLTAAGGIAGGIVGTPVIGSALGAGAGSATGKLLQSLKPEWFGEYKPEAPQEIVKDVGTDIAFDLAGSGLAKGASYAIPNVAKNAVQRALSKIFSTDLKATNLNALQADPNFPVSVGQTNKFADWTENVFAPSAKRKFVHEQEENILQEARKFQYDPEIIIQTGQTNAAANIAVKKSAKDLAYEAFEPFKAKNTKQFTHVVPSKGAGFGKPALQTKTIDIPGAIEVKHSYAFADTAGKDIDAILGPDPVNNAYIGTGTGSHLVKIRQELGKIRRIGQSADPNDPTKVIPERYGSFDQLKQIKTDINNFLFDGSVDAVTKDRLRGTLSGLAKTIDNDIEAGVQSWGKQAYRQYKKAQTLHKELAEKVDPQMARDLMKAGADPDTTYLQVAKSALSDPMKMRQFIDITQDRTTAKQLFMSNLIDNSIDAVGDRLDPKKALDFINDPVNKLVEKAAVPSPTRTNFERFLRRAQLVEPHVGSANVALKLRTAVGGLSLAVGFTSYMAGGATPTNSMLLGGSVVLGARGIHEFAKRVLLNPKNARIATGLLSADPISKEAKSRTKGLLLAMKGMQVSYLSPDGKELPAEITPDGRVKILSESQAQPSQ